MASPDLPTVIPELNRGHATIDVLGTFAVVQSPCDDLVSSLLVVSPTNFGLVEGRLAWRRLPTAFSSWTLWASPLAIGEF
jgi:hypothetical protein